MKRQRSRRSEGLVDPDGTPARSPITGQFAASFLMYQEVRMSHSAYRHPSRQMMSNHWTVRLLHYTGLGQVREQCPAFDVAPLFYESAC